MTAPVDVRAERLTLVARLERLAGRVEAVVDGGGLAAGFAQAIVDQLAPALADAVVQADEVGMLRAQAADREGSRAVLQSVLGDLQHLAVLIDATDSGALSKRWLVEHLRAVIVGAGESLKTEWTTNA